MAQTLQAILRRRRGPVHPVLDPIGEAPVSPSEEDEEDGYVMAYAELEDDTGDDEDPQEDEGLSEMDADDIEYMEPELVQPVASFWSRFCTEIATSVEEAQGKEERAVSLVSRLDYLVQERLSSSIDGDLVMKRLNHTLSSFQWKRSDSQVLFHECFNRAILKRAYGSSWEANAVRVMSSLGLSRLKTEVMIMTPRRWGKSVAVAMWIAGALVNIPSVSIGVFSTGQRASTYLMDLVLRFLHEVPDGFQRIIKQTDAELMVGMEALPPGCGPRGVVAQQRRSLATTSKLQCFPSSVDSKCIRLSLGGMEGICSKLIEM